MTYAPRAQATSAQATSAQAPGRTAFVFAGGGSLGAIQVGALRELAHEGVRPDFVVGASVGALNACFFAGRPDAAGVAALEDIWRGLRRQDIFPVTLRGALGWLRGGPGIFESHALRALIERHLPVPNLEDSPLPVHVVATSLSGAAVTLSRGSAVDAVLASSAIPIAFPSVQIGMDHLMDGAVAGNTPILTAAELGASRIIVLQTGYACSMDGPPRGAVARGMHALTLMIANQMERDLSLLAGQVDVHVAPHLCPLDISPFNFEHSGRLIERSAQATRQWLDAGGLSFTSTPEAFDHRHDAMAARPRVAVSGLDLVSYFSGAARPVFGSADHAHMHEGATYLFASAASRDAFAADPARYLPQYGGSCAFAVARNSDAHGDPMTFRIVDGRLFFNLNAGVQEKWERDMAGAIARADAFWMARGPARVAAKRG